MHLLSKLFNSNRPHSAPSQTLDAFNIQFQKTKTAVKNTETVLATEKVVDEQIAKQCDVISNNSGKETESVIQTIQALHVIDTLLQASKYEHFEQLAKDKLVSHVEYSTLIEKYTIGCNLDNLLSLNQCDNVEQLFTVKKLSIPELNKQITIMMQ